MKILLRSVNSGRTGGYIATIEGVPGSRQGDTMGEAVGNIVMSNLKTLGIEIDFPPEDNKKTMPCSRLRA